MDKLPRFYRWAIMFSFVVNVILVLVLLSLPFILRPILSQVMAELDNLENAVIETTVEIDQGMPVQDVLIQVQQPLTVTTITDSSIDAAYVTMYLGNGSQVAGTTYINMPAGTELPIDFLNRIVMSSTIPVRLSVPVAIPLNETPLASSFAHFTEMLSPVARLLGVTTD
ncbi:MAG: hypothetical protein JXA37_13285 [Chloroflexia bacterium]|nr:hypothetical protein [Chloroflexia bacterium]